MDTTFSKAEKEYIVCVARHNAIVSTLASVLDPLLDGGAPDRGRIDAGLRFDEALCFAISGANAIHGVPLYRVGEWPHLAPSGAIRSVADSYRRIRGESVISDAHLPLDPMSPVVQRIIRAGIITVGVDGEQLRSPPAFWWSGDDDDDRYITDSSVVRAALATTLYSCSADLTQGPQGPPDAAVAIQGVMGKIGALRAELSGVQDHFRTFMERCEADLLAARQDIMPEEDRDIRDRLSAASPEVWAAVEKARSPRG
ncbi:hypothetical protein PENSPDRAFT_693303 [Peniophora sp. CONT]|nr:hypothetical protein PENSPDRAFT_693303 [Peniophora sp. CONT]